MLLTKNRILVRGVFAGADCPSDVILKDGRVETVKPAGRASPDVGSLTAIIAPTLFDIQINGAKGIDLQSLDITPAGICTLNDFLASQGVSHWIPTIITGSPENMIHSCAAIAEAMTEPRRSFAVRLTVERNERKSMPYSS